MNGGLIETLARTVGTANLLTDGSDFAGYASDGRGAAGIAAAVVRPATVAEVAEVVRAAVAAGGRVVPQGLAPGWSLPASQAQVATSSC